MRAFLIDNIHLGRIRTEATKPVQDFWADFSQRFMTTSIGELTKHSFENGDELVLDLREWSEEFFPSEDWPAVLAEPGWGSCKVSQEILVPVVITPRRFILLRVSVSEANPFEVRFVTQEFLLGLDSGHPLRWLLHGGPDPERTIKDFEKNFLPKQTGTDKKVDF